MDELILYLRLLHINDPQMQKIFLAGGAEQVAGKGPVKIRRPNQRMAAVYPVGLISGDEDDVFLTGEGLPKFISGRVRVEWRTRVTDDSRDNLAILKALKERSWALIQGKKATPALTYTLPHRGTQTVLADPESLPTIINTRIGPASQIVWCQQVAPTRDMPTVDESIAAHQTTYEVKLSRYNL